MQQTELGLNLSTKRTRKREFLTQMDRVVPWADLVALVAPYCPEGQSCRPPFSDPEAETGLADAASYYAEHASMAMAEGFLAEFERVCDLLVENQFRGAHGELGFRLYHFDRYPYTVVYETDTRAGPQIFAIAHQHRAPGYWTDRL